MEQHSDKEGCLDAQEKGRVQCKNEEGQGGLPEIEAKKGDL